MREYTVAEKSYWAIASIGAGFARMATDAVLLYCTYALGYGMLFGFGVLLANMVLWSVLVVNRLHIKIKEVFAGELERASERNTTWKDLAFAVMAAYAKRGGK